jgi:hypothetical protein
MDRNLALEVVRVTEAAALASARLMGRGDAAAVDRAAAQAMRRGFEAIHICGTVVVGEGEEGETDELFVGQKIGSGQGPEIDVALDALEGATVCATGGANALSIILIAERGRILLCPKTYMEKIAVGPEGKGVIDIDRPPAENLRALADAKGVYVEDLTAVVLDRPRHERLVEEVRRAGARVRTATSPRRLLPAGRDRASMSSSGSEGRSRECWLRPPSTAWEANFRDGSSRSLPTRLRGSSRRGSRISPVGIRRATWSAKTPCSPQLA